MTKNDTGHAKTLVTVDNVTKHFVLPHEKNNSLKSSIVNIFKSKDKDVDIQKTLQGVSFKVEEGDFFGILGRNGSGKSTLLKILAEIYRPTTGNVRVKGKLVPFIELGVGFNPELTGRENVYLNGALLGFSKKEIDEKYQEIVDFAELGEFMDQRLKNYSSGMQVRLAFSVATRAEADILLVDEVLAVGDADFQRKCFDYFKALKKKHTTVIFVSHDMSAVREYCNKAILVDQGKIIHSGSGVKTADEYVKLFTESEEAEAEDVDATKRWGNRHVVFDAVKVTQDKEVVIKCKVAARRDVDGVMFGFRIRDASGMPVLGTNTKVEGLTSFSMKKGEVMDIVWKFDNILNDGKYFIDPAIQLDDYTTVCDWWDEATTISVKRKERTPYPVAPNFTVEAN